VGAKQIVGQARRLPGQAERLPYNGFIRQILAADFHRWTHYFFIIRAIRVIRGLKTLC
jgi:hypothetical protein